MVEHLPHGPELRTSIASQKEKKKKRNILACNTGKVKETHTYTLMHTHCIIM
jgi:hypothetical protein